MASLTIQQTINSWSYVQLVITEQAIGSDEIANNYSDVDWRLEVYRQYSWVTSTAKSGWVKIDNVTVWSGSNTLGGSGTKVLASGTKRIYHNLDGTKPNMAVAFFQEIQLELSGVWRGDYSGSGTLSLSAIPRASLLALNNNNFNIGDTISLSVTEFDPSFTYKWHHDFRDGFWSPFTPTYVSEGDYYYYETPLEAWLDNITTGTSGNGRIRLETWNSSQTTKIGEKIIYFTALVPDWVVPTCTLDLSFNDLFGVYALKNVSSAYLEIQSEAGAFGSTITSYHIEGPGLNFNTKSGTSTVFSQIGTFTYSGYVMDSRGRKSPVQTQSFTVTDYYAPIIDIDYYRALNDGTRDDANGTYIHIATSFDIAQVPGLGLAVNRIFIDDVLVASDLQNEISGNYGEYSLAQTHKITFQVEDMAGGLTTVVREVKIGTVPFNIGIAKNMVAVGKYANRVNAFEVAPTWEIYAKGVPIVEWGTNANGDFIRYYDGTQITYQKLTMASVTINAGAYQLQGDWTYPASFVYVPNIAINQTSSWSHAFQATFDGVTTTATTGVKVVNRSTSNLTTAHVIHLMAIGRWK